VAAIIGPVEEALKRLATRDDALHGAGPCARDVVRASKRAIAAAHSGEDAGPAIGDLGTAVAGLLTRVEGVGGLESSGTIEGALQEYAEAMIAVAIIRGSEVPGSDDLGIGAVPYVLGAADAVGELRRAMLDAIGRGDMASAGRLFSEMRSLYDLLAGCTVSNEAAPLRRKVDVARGLVERSHGDLTGAIVAGRARDGR